MRYKSFAALLSLTVISVVIQVNCDIFSSSSHLQSLMYLERHIIEGLNDYVISAENQIKEIRSYMREYVNSVGSPHLKGLKEKEEVIGNPLQAFQLLKRLTVNWNNVQNQMKISGWQKLEKMVEEYKSLMPHTEDLHGAALALVRLQDTYNLNMTDMAAGNIQDFNTRIEMTARDCLYLGKHSFNNGYYGQAIEWFEESLIRANREGNATAPVDEILPFYNMVLKIHDELLPNYDINATSFSAPPPTRMRFVDGDNDDYRNYQALCRGASLRSPQKEKDLKCYLSDRGHPWLILQPVKVEEHSKDPYIVMFYDLMTENESDHVRDIAAPQLQRAKVQTDEGKAGNKEEISGTRTSQTAWFMETEYEIVARLNRRIETVTGLSADMNKGHSELMQVANYGMGGHYIPHYDYLIVDRPEDERHLVEERDRYAGDRTATLMFYLTDVERGGSTVFPRLGVKLTPTKNSAAFWYNLKRNGEAVVDTVHGACPVLMGEKWVANHWLRELGQTFRRRCTLDPEE